MKVIDAPSAFHATDVRVSRGILYVTLSPTITIQTPIEALGDPWVSASPRAVANVRLRFGGSVVFWDDLDEALELDEWIPTEMQIRAGALLAKAARGKKASTAKAAAARANGAKGGRPKKAVA